MEILLAILAGVITILLIILIVVLVDILYEMRQNRLMKELERLRLAQMEAELREKIKALLSNEDPSQESTWNNESDDDSTTW